MFSFSYPLLYVDRPVSEFEFKAFFPSVQAICLLWLCWYLSFLVFLLFSLHLWSCGCSFVRHFCCIYYSRLNCVNVENSDTYLLTYLLTLWCRIVFEKLIVTQLVKQYPTFFMESEGSLPGSQNPATGPYPEPIGSSSLHRSLSP